MTLTMFIDRFFKIKHSIFVVFSYIYLKHNKLENVFRSFPENKIEIDITELKVTSFVIGYFLSSSGIVITLQNYQIVC